MKLLGVSLVGVVIAYTAALLWAVEIVDQCFGKAGERRQ